MDLNKYQDLHQKFHELFNKNPLTIRSPGRVNLIGDHTDYNQGFVLPAAIDKEIILCMGLNQTADCNLYSWDMQEEYSFPLGNLEHAPLGWANYVIGTVQQLVKSGNQLAGFDCVFGGDIPIGAGLSSSAALECGVAWGLNELLKFGLTRIEIARLAQAAEGDFVGVQCGLMDQYANMFGKAGHLIQLDCRAEAHKSIQVDFRDFGLYLFNSRVEHELAGSEYNVRRKECEKGIKIIRKKFPEITSLRDCDKTQLNYINEEIVHRRCEFVLEENQRVIDGTKDLVTGNLEAFGVKMYLSHQGLRDKYQVSCPELDLLVALTEGEESVLGARMMGGGFGGCTINLIRSSAAGSLIGHFGVQYRKKTGRDMDVYPVTIANGTSLVSKDLISSPNN